MPTNNEKPRGLFIIRSHPLESVEHLYWNPREGVKMILSNTRRINKLTAMAAVLLAFCLALTAFALPGQAEAEAYKSGDSTKAVTIGKTQVSASSYTNSDGRTAYRIYVSKNGSWSMAAEKADQEFLTNGRYLFYAKQVGNPDQFGIYKQVIYRKDLKTGKQKKLGSGRNWEPFASNGTYLYCGTRFTSVSTATLYAVNVKSKAKTKMPSRLMKAVYGGGRVVSIKCYMQVGNYPIYSFNKQGKGKKKIASGFNYIVKGKKLYYSKYRYKNGVSQYRVYCCPVKGGSSKALTKWGDNNILKKYGLA